MKKLTIQQVKKIKPSVLLKLINRMKKFLKQDPVVQKAFKEYKIPIEELDSIPMRFADLNVSARTDHGIICFNYKLLCDGDFFKDIMYAVHEIIHYLQQTSGDGPTQGAAEGDYLDNPYELEGFQHQVKYIDNMFGDQNAKKYVDKVLDHHEVNDKNEREEKKKELMEMTEE